MIGTSVATGATGITHHPHGRIFRNWLNIAVFVVLAMCYAWFAFFERISVFDSLDKGVM